MVTICFNRISKYELPECHLTIGGRQIPYSTETRYLGVHLDSRVNWTYHFNLKVSSTKRLLFKLKNALGAMWGPKPYLICWMFMAVIRLALTYRSLVWAHILVKKFHLQKLIRLHSLIFEMLCHKRKSTPIVGMGMITYLLSEILISTQRERQ